jgi:hypothetical protein
VKIFILHLFCGQGMKWILVPLHELVHTTYAFILHGIDRVAQVRKGVNDLSREHGVKVGDLTSSSPWSRHADEGYSMCGQASYSATTAVMRVKR